MRACRSAHIITGLPDAYGRGRIIGDYRRPALYGVDRLIEDKEEQLATTRTIMYSDVIREREELSEQIRALKMLKELAKIYGCDISKPANNVLEATQAVYFSYLAAVKEQNGAAMSLGRTSTFLDIYFERDPGDHRPVCHEAALREVCTYAGVQLHLRWGSDLGDGVDRRNRCGRQTYGDEDVLPLLKYTQQHRSSAGAEYDRALVGTASGEF